MLCSYAEFSCYKENCCREVRCWPRLLLNVLEFLESFKFQCQQMEALLERMLVSERLAHEMVSSLQGAADYLVEYQENCVKKGLERELYASVGVKFDLVETGDGDEKKCKKRKKSKMDEEDKSGTWSCGEESGGYEGESVDEDMMGDTSTDEEAPGMLFSMDD